MTINYYAGNKQNFLNKHLVINVFKEKRNGTCMECGALDGVSLSLTKVFEESFDWKCINVEADPESFSKLVANRPKSINLNYALSSSDNQYLHFASNQRKPKLSKISNVETNIKVPTITYRTLIDELTEKHGIQEIDLFVLDVEGHEEQAIEGMKNAKIFPNYLLLEIHNESEEDLMMKQADKIIQIKKTTGCFYSVDFVSGYNTLLKRETA